MSDPTTTSTPTASSSSTSTTSPSASTSASPLQTIMAGLDSPAFIVPVVILGITTIALIVFAIVYNCCNRAATRRRYIEYHSTASAGWIPDCHVPEKLMAARQEQAVVYRYA